MPTRPSVPSRLPADLVSKRLILAGPDLFVMGSIARCAIDGCSAFAWAGLAAADVFRDQDRVVNAFRQNGSMPELNHFGDHMSMKSTHHPLNAVPRFALCTGLVLACVCGVLSADIASAECSEKARALGKCPPTHAIPKAKSNVHVAGTTPIQANTPKTATKIVRTGPGGPSPIQHSGKNALNPQPIPPGHVLHPLPPPGAPNEGGGH